MTEIVKNTIARPDSTGDNVYNLAGTVNITGTVTNTAASDTLKSVVNTVTLAELNAGKTILADLAGRTVKPVAFTITVSGDFTTGTSIEIEDTNGTPIVIASVAQAGLTDGAVIKEDETNTTVGAGFLGSLTAGKGIAVTKTGSDFAGGTSITVKVDYYLA